MIQKHLLVVMDGQIVERSTHQQLLAVRKYYDLYTSNTLGRSVETTLSGNGRDGQLAAVPA
jgi:hypothetical protein